MAWVLQIPEKKLLDTIRNISDVGVVPEEKDDP
jgi:hypothetical protein